MISPFGFRMVRSEGRIHSLGRFHIGGSAHGCMGASAQCRGNGPKARTGSSPHDLFDHNVKAAFVEVLCGSIMVSALLAPTGEAQAPQARGVHRLPRYVEYHTAADAVIETQ